MATYTDFHNRVKENINVDYHSRITPQKVRLLNEENEYWGTLKGNISAEDIVINGGNISNVTICNATLSGEVKVGDVDIIKIGNTVETLSDNYDKLDSKINSIANISALSNNLNDLSNKLSAVDNEAISSINENIDGLSDDLSNLSNLFLSSIEFNSGEHKQFRRALNDLSNDYISADKKILSDLKDLSTSNTEIFNALSTDYISRITRDRHYAINEYKNTYPYKLQDYAVNVFNLDIPTARVTYYDTASNTHYEIGLISSNESLNPVVFKPYNDIKFLPLDYAFEEDKTYTLSDDAFVYTRNYYKVGKTADGDKLQLKVVSDYKWYNVLFDNVIIGRITDFKIDEKSKCIESGKLNIDTNIDVLTCFNQFKDIIVINNDSKLWTQNGYKISLSDNILTLTKNYVERDAYNLINKDDSEQFGYIYKDELEYQKIDDNNKILSGLTVNINFDKPLPVHKNDIKLNNESLSDKLSTYSDNTEIWLKADFNPPKVKLTAYDCKKIYAYQLSGVTSDGNISSRCTIIPNAYNKPISSLNDLSTIDVISVDITTLVDVDNFKHIYPLHKTENETKWTNEIHDDKGNTLNINLNVSENKSSLAIMITSYDSNEDASINNGIITYEFNDDISKIKPIIYNDNENDSNYWYKEIYTTEIDTSNITYYPKWSGIDFEAKISEKPETNDINEYVLDVEQENVDSFKFIIPSKAAKDNYISREFFITIKLNSLESKDVNIEFIDENGNSLSNNIFYNKQHEVTVHACPVSEVSAWTTFMVNEIQNNKYLITDLNDTIDHEKLNDIYSKIDYLSSVICSVSTELSINFLSTLSSISSDLSVALSDETSARISSDDYLSNAIDKKLYINGISVESLSTTYLDQSNFEGILSSNISSDANELYVVSALNSNAPSTVVSNDLFNKTLATKNYVDVSVNNLQNQILSNDSDISSISNDIYKSDTGLSAQVSALSADLSNHYHKTFTQVSSVEYGIDKEHPEDVYDALIIPNAELMHEKYRLLYLSGTLVLEKID